MYTVASPNFVVTIKNEIHIEHVITIKKLNYKKVSEIGITKFFLPQGSLLDQSSPKQEKT